MYNDSADCLFLAQRDLTVALDLLGYAGYGEVQGHVAKGNPKHHADILESSSWPVLSVDFMFLMEQLVQLEGVARGERDYTRALVPFSRQPQRLPNMLEPAGAKHLSIHFHLQVSRISPKTRGDDRDVRVVGIGDHVTGTLEPVTMVGLAFRSLGF